VKYVIFWYIYIIDTAGVEVDNMTLRDVLQENHGETQLPLIQNDGHIGKLRLDAISVSETFDGNAISVWV
jgi:hypothetical protein